MVKLILFWLKKNNLVFDKQEETGHKKWNEINCGRAQSQAVL